MWEQVIKFFGDENTKTLKGFQKQVDKINELEPMLKSRKEISEYVEPHQDCKAFPLNYYPLTV